MAKYKSHDIIKYNFQWIDRMLGETLKKYRQKRGWTQIEFSDILGVKYTTLTKLEGGFIKEPTIKNIYRISKTLQVPIEDLLQENFNQWTIPTFDLRNRRFLGNKFKLLGFIEKIVTKEVPQFYSFCDIFAGTGVVGQYFGGVGKKIISNDMLLSNYIPLKTFLNIKHINLYTVQEKITRLNSVKGIADNYFSENYGGTYFTMKNARRIGAIREAIEHIAETEDERNILITSLIYATDKVANTVGHYDAYRKNLDSNKDLKLKTPNIDFTGNKENEVYQEDANKLIKNVHCDILYIDPPYNSRQYCDTYHLLENLAMWKKPKVYGKAKKMNRNHLKSNYCLKSATRSFEDLIQNAQCQHILLSYNNTKESKDSRSNARIRDTDIVRILKDKGETQIFEREHKAFTTGKSNGDGNTERIFYCKIVR